VTHRKAEEYRRLAQECIALALTVSTLDASLVAMAQVWQRLADEQEQGSEFGPIAAHTPADAQAIAQQQQQVQPDDEK